MSAYAGIGSRETPPDMLDLMRWTADRLACDGWTLRSGNAPGADQAFATGHLAAISGSPIELYLPWASFETDAIKEWTADIIARMEPQPEAYGIAARHHPAWDRLGRGARALHARNVHQVLGRDVTKPDPSAFVICWTPGARGGGGTGQAIRVARAYDVPVFDLANPEARRRVETWLAGERAAA